ncbi:hypothetical protein HLB44_36225 [Aquincola sp. S2]|uniref:PEP-CTERM protein-sorting domain-containing protein n=1 Tax=Pseudaquabacterium terrae TaxID=2732868 RepID=A0ABX2EVC6_9BURK|nr:hypothetical protein [Aquabacterium terrae]NRF72412.1 hypothetical protein [Aquabacterium terrae]
MRHSPLHSLCGALGLFVALLGSTNANPILHTSDFIQNSQRLHFNGFEGLHATGSYGGPYVEDLIRVEQVFGRPNSIASIYMPVGFEGARSWYANGGDHGYTRITLSDGSDFYGIGLLRGTGSLDVSNPNQLMGIYYELWLDGVLVEAGNPTVSGNASYIGFSGGGFNEVRIRDSGSTFINSFGNGTPASVDSNSLAIDSIEIAAATQPVPEPHTFPLVLTALAAVGLAFRGRVKSRPPLVARVRSGVT